MEKALDLASTLLGGSQLTGIHWNDADTLALPDPEAGDEFPVADANHAPQVDFKQATLADVLEGGMDALELDEDDSTDYGHNVNAVIHWDFSEVHLY